MYARVTSIRVPRSMKVEVVSVARGLGPILSQQRGFEALQVLMDPDAGEGIVVSMWETVAHAEASEASASYIGQMSMMSSFLCERIAPQTYEVSVRA